MRILFLTPQLPWPAAQGTALRNFHLLKAAATQHEVHLLSFGASGASLGPLTELCARVEVVPFPLRTMGHRLRDLLLGHADMERRLWSPPLADGLRQMLRTGGYDVVQLEGFEVAGYLLGPPALWEESNGCAPWDGSQGRVPKLVFDDHNAEYELQRSAARIDWRRWRRWPRAMYSTLQARRLRRREALYCAAADACLAVSAEDAAALEYLVPHLGAVVVPNGVDCAAMPLPSPGSEPVIFFSGKLDYRPNVDACEWLVSDVLPRVRCAVREARVVLAGRDPCSSVRALASSHVEVTGALDAEQLAHRRSQAWVYAVPMRMGSGVRFKVLEAMAAGVPLVATSLGAAGSGAVHGQHALIAEDAATFASAVVTLLQDQALRERLAGSSKELAEARHDWRHIGPRLLDVYDRVTNESRRPAAVITTLLNERSSVEPLIASLAGQMRRPDKLIVTDGGSVDGTPAAVQRAAAKQALPISLETRAGANISQGRNAAIARADNELIAATDGGVSLHPSWLQRLLSPLEQDVALQLAAGFFVSSPQTLWERALGATTLPAVEDIEPSAFLPSSRSVAFRKAAWQAAGGYPEWLDYGEDLVFDLALIRNGARPRFVPRATVRFRPRTSPSAFFLQYLRYARGDGKAGLWPRRHAVRYASYVAAAALLCLAAAPSNGQRRPLARPAGVGLLRQMARLGLFAGGVTYLRRPLLRLWQRSPSLPAFIRAAPLVPLVRLIGDVAKMAGYPAGVWWRLKHRDLLP